MTKQKRKLGDAGNRLVIILLMLAVLSLVGIVGWRILKARDSSTEQSQSSSTAQSLKGNTTRISIKAEGGCSESENGCGTYIFEGKNYTVQRNRTSDLKGSLPDDIAAELTEAAKLKPDQEGTKPNCISSVDGTDYTAEISYEDVVSTQSTCYENQDPRSNGDPTQKYRYSYNSKLFKAFDRAVAFIHQKR